MFQDLILLPAIIIAQADATMHAPNPGCLGLFDPGYQSAARALVGRRWSPPGGM
jgi:hypothetical protein